MSSTSSNCNLHQDPSAETATAKPPGAREALWKKLRAENEERKAKEVQHVSSQEAENVTGYGEQRTRREEEEERKETNTKGGNGNLAAALAF
jgi:hypothetical protein